MLSTRVGELVAEGLVTRIAEPLGDAPAHTTYLAVPRGSPSWSTSASGSPKRRLESPTHRDIVRREVAPQRALHAPFAAEDGVVK